MKLLCVLLPHFPLRCEVQQEPSLEGLPALVTYAMGSQRLVLDYSDGLEGLQRGMPLQQALALHGDARMVPADIPRYWEIFDRILDALEEKSPLVEGIDLGYAYLGLDGLQLIYPTDDALIDAVKEVIPAIFSARFGIAGGKFPAYLAALHSPPGGCLTLTGDMQSFLKDLSCDVLPISLKSRKKLHDFGIRTLGEVAALPQGPVQAQFGPEGKRIWQLARGHDDTPLYPRSLEEVIEESAASPSAAGSLEAVLVTAETLLSRIFAGNRLKGKGIRNLIIWARIWGAGYWERSIQYKEPAADVKSALSRIKHILQNAPLPGPVEELGLKLTGLSGQRGRQGSLFSEVRARDHLLEDVRRLELRMGAPQVFRIKEVEPWSRIPERRRTLTPLSQ